MAPSTLISVYCLLIVGASLGGGWLPSLVRMTHRRMQLAISFVGGLMLGIAVFHLLPHAVGPEMSLDRAVWWMMIGLLVMFFLLRTFHFHHHGPAEEEFAQELASVGEVSDHEHHDHDHHGHDHAGHQHAGHDHAHGAGEHRLSWVGVAFGLAVHTAIDGIALAASVVAESHAHDNGAAQLALFAGVGTFLAVMLHKPLDAMSITSLMAAGGWTVRAQQTVNIMYSLMCPLGALLFYFGVNGNTDSQGVIVGAALAFSAGVFLCISLGDLLPELSFHSHDRVTLSLALLFGVALAYGIGFLEPHHAHYHGGQDHSTHGADHPEHDQGDHSGHDHAH